MSKVGTRFKLFPCVALAIFFLAGTVRANDAEVRAAVQKIFQQLQSKDYAGLYEVLPESSRARITRDRFTAALQRAQNIYTLDRLEVGAVRVAGNLAVVDTVLYGKVVVPVQTEGKIVVQQYLVREGGNWRVATGDRATIDRFLKSNPAFGKSFRIREPRIFVKQNGEWVAFRIPGRR